MEITFADAKLQKLCNDGNKLRGKYGPRQAGLIQQRLADLAAAATLKDMEFLPGRCHDLKHDRKLCVSVDLVHPDRLVFRPAHDPPPLTAGNSLDWSQVTAIEVVGIGDYH